MTGNLSVIEELAQVENQSSPNVDNPVEEHHFLSDNKAANVQCCTDDVVDKAANVECCKDHVNDKAAKVECCKDHVNDKAAKVECCKDHVNDKAAKVEWCKKDADEISVDNSLDLFWCKTDPEDANNAQVDENAFSIHRINNAATENVKAAVEHDVSAKSSIENEIVADALSDFCVEEKKRQKLNLSKLFRRFFRRK
ncbi:hypothetical protein DPMN_096845 [Dreissena polymorpha]|uniref:Uncharacterized protein n=1 Tax=Dreissena polymorpha TaxID=45954 RepID=A0A9D4R4V5_DREPO|nr:hypothetical protein DPMN_096845 [Dreissena polymorpha]